MLSHLDYSTNQPGTNELIGPFIHSVRDPNFTKASDDQSARAIHGCGNQVPGTQRLKPSLLTQGIYMGVAMHMRMGCEMVTNHEDNSC